MSPASTEEYLTAAGDEAGTAPGDRRFRPDVQGLRAISILLVVLFHADIPGVRGGYVGVDVFFVISGFVITGLLLRERETAGSTSFRSFYSRRARRIIPAASVVIIVTVLAAYIFIGSAAGRQSGVDGQWAAVFLANFHFAAEQTNYLASQSPPSPLQNYWSLAVEEQFYIVFPTIFFLVAGRFARTSLRARIGSVLTVAVIGSYVASILYTSANPASAFFSPFTRIWELALGGLLAAGTSHLRRLPPSVAAVLSWIGLGAVLVSALVFTSATAYPGSLAAIPVVGAALIIAGGTAQPAWGVEVLLRQRPLQFLGLISYSLYLWHWPILVVAAESRGVTTLPVWDNVALLVVALVVAIVSYQVIENPLRHSVALISRRWASIMLGGCLVLSTLAVTTVAVAATKPAITGGIAVARSGSNCRSPSRRKIASARSLAKVAKVPDAAAAASHPIQMLVVGDSTACSMLLGLAAVGASYGVHVENAAVIGCGIVSGTLAPDYFNNRNIEAYTARCAQKAERVESRQLASGAPDIILWSSTDEGDSVTAARSGRTTVLTSGSPAWKSVMLQRIDARLQQFIATGAKVILLLQPAKVHRSHGLDTDDLGFEHLNGLLTEAAARYPRHVDLVDLASRVCPKGPPCPYVVDGLGRDGISTDAVRPDDLHYGVVGSIWVAKWLLPRIVAEAGRRS
jgi:peptidoglycan/LPS O-acetylase OafA/YrhL